MSNIDKRATELLIENGVLVADTLRHLADNEIDSDYFAICHSNENGTEIECELAITDYARQAAGTVDELVKALEAAEKRIAELQAPAPELKMAHLINKFYERYPLAEFKSDTERSAALGYFMAGAELQCFGEFINYAELMGDE